MKQLSTPDAEAEPKVDAAAVVKKETSDKKPRQRKPRERKPKEAKVAEVAVETSTTIEPSPNPRLS